MARRLPLFDGLEKISYCIKDSAGKIHAEGSLPATRADLDRRMKTLPQPCSAAMEATMFTSSAEDTDHNSNP